MKMSCKILFTIFITISLFSLVSCEFLAGNYNENNDAEYDVTFDKNTNSGQADLTTVQVRHNNKVTKPEDPVKIDYTFVQQTNKMEAKRFVFIGWYSDKELKNRFDFDTKITENRTLYAKWRPIANSKIILGSGNNAVSYDKTEEVYVIDADKVEDDITTITCEVPKFIDEGADTMYNGVFWGRPDVKLDPFIMGRYEVTQELYEAIMTGNNIGVDATPWICEGDDYPLPETEETTAAAADDDDDDEDDDDDTVDEQGYRPVEFVTWYDAVYFCNRLTAAVGGGLNAAYTITNIVVGDADDEDEEFPGHIISANVSLVAGATGYRLPTEAEWEFAARGGDTSLDIWNYMFSGADTADGNKYSANQNSGLDTVAWYAFNTSTEDGKSSTLIPEGEDRASYGTHPVGQKAPNELGLFDMSGNVFEWCYDKVTKFAVKNPASIVESEDNKRITRGGSWFNNASKCVVSNRSVNAPGSAAADIGFRVVRSVALN